MVYSEIIAGLHAEFGTFHEVWQAEVQAADDMGALVFLPSAYSNAVSLDGVRHRFWTVAEVSAYLLHGGRSDSGLLELLLDFDIEAEFLVLIVEHVDGEQKHAAHIHRLSEIVTDCG